MTTMNAFPRTADADSVLDRPSLYELAGVDRGRYTIVGVDLTIWEDTTTASVYAVDRVTGDWGALIDENMVGLSYGASAVLAPAFCLISLTVAMTLMVDAISQGSRE